MPLPKPSGDSESSLLRNAYVKAPPTTPMGKGSTHGLPQRERTILVNAGRPQAGDSPMGWGLLLLLFRAVCIPLPVIRGRSGRGRSPQRTRELFVPTGGGGRPQCRQDQNQICQRLTKLFQLVRAPPPCETTVTQLRSCVFWSAARAMQEPLSVEVSMGR